MFIWHQCHLIPTPSWTIPLLISKKPVKNWTNFALSLFSQQSIHHRVCSKLQVSHTLTVQMQADIAKKNLQNFLNPRWQSYLWLTKLVLHWTVGDPKTTVLNYWLWKLRKSSACSFNTRGKDQRHNHQTTEPQTCHLPQAKLGTFGWAVDIYAHLPHKSVTLFSFFPNTLAPWTTPRSSRYLIVGRKQNCSASKLLWTARLRTARTKTFSKQNTLHERLWTTKTLPTNRECPAYLFIDRKELATAEMFCRWGENHLCLIMNCQYWGDTPTITQHQVDSTSDKTTRTRPRPPEFKRHFEKPWHNTTFYLIWFCGHMNSAKQ